MTNVLSSVDILTGMDMSFAQIGIFHDGISVTYLVPSNEVAAQVLETAFGDDAVYDKAKADRAVKFIESLCHTKGKWAGKRFWLLPWQEQLIRDIFGIVKPDGNRQFRTAFVEICKKVGG